jgi:hypothetical protein
MVPSNFHFNATTKKLFLRPFCDTKHRWRLGIKKKKKKIDLQELDL